MNGEIKTYKVNGKTYDIPPEREQEFLSEFKDAVELKSYIVNKDTFDIPVSKEVDFLKDFPDAQPTFGVKKKTRFRLRNLSFLHLNNLNCRTVPRLKLL